MILRNLELIGEAATHIPDGVRVAHPENPWRMIIAARNKLIHGHPGIDNDTLRSIIQTSYPDVGTFRVPRIPRITSIFGSDTAGPAANRE